MTSHSVTSHSVTDPPETNRRSTNASRATTDFVHLANRTCYSLRDGVIRPRELARATAQAGMSAAGIADRGGLYGGVRFAQACVAEGIRPIYGTDLALYPDLGTRHRQGVGAPDDGRPGWGISRASSSGIGRDMGPSRMYPGSGQAWLEDDAPRVTLIATDTAGFATVNRTITDHHMDSQRSDPHLTWQQAVSRLGAVDDSGRNAAGGVFVLLTERSPVGRLLAEGRPDAARTEARQWMDLVGPGQLLVGITHHLAPGDDARARATFALADDLGLRAVAHQAARYLHRGDARVADVMDAVRQQVPLARNSRLATSEGSSPNLGGNGRTAGTGLRQRRNAEGYLKDPEAMARIFRERPDAISNTVWVADQCDVDIGLGRLRVPDFASGGPGQTDTNGNDWALAELRGRCEHGIAERFPNPGDGQFATNPAGHARQLEELLDRELAMVHQLGLAPYFLTVAEIMGRIRAKGILAACRGSAAGSLITYALRISDVDPIAHDLAFERFMNPYRDELPDIDIDVESARREEIYTDLLDTYGTDRVACVSMVETFKARMAIREVGKALGLPAGEIDYVAKSFPHVRASDVRPALAHLPELQGINLDGPAKQVWDLLFDVVERMDGFPRHIALHPCGILLADTTLRDFVPMERSAKGFAMAQYDKDDIAALGLCKLDVLAVRMLSSMAHCIQEVRGTRGSDINFDDVPWNDKGTYELIQSTRTLGMFQIESPGQRELVGKFQPEHINDLVVDISLFRPGPVKGDMIKPFLRRRHGEEGSGVPHPILERALGETFGVIVYHEQVMRCVAAVTGCDLAEADLVRRRLGDPTELPGLERWVREGAASRGVPPDVVDWLWVALSQFASFGFCKAHAAAFSVPTYRSAWLKAHYLPEFVAGLLTHDPGMYPRRLILDDARQFGVAVLPLDVNASAADYRVEVIRTDEALALLGVPPHDPDATFRPGGAQTRNRAMPRGWRWNPDGELIPSAGFDKGKADPGWRYGIRLGLQDVERIDDHMIESLLTRRPFTSTEDLRLRSRLSAPVAEALTHAGALDVIGGVGLPTSTEPGSLPKTRRDLLLEVTERWSGLKRYSAKDPEQPQQLGLLPVAESPGLPAYRPSERVRAEMEVTGMDATRHVVTFYDTLLDTIGITRASDLLDCRENQRVRIAGIKVATQTPPVKSGQRIIFLSLDDGTGIGDATFFESVHDRCAWTVFHTWLLVVEGIVHRTGKRGVTLTADRAWDMRRLMTAWQGDWLPQALAETGRPTGPRVPADRRQPDRDFGDQAPSSAIRGAAGRSGIRLPGREGDHLEMVQTVPFGGAGPGAAAAAAARGGIAASSTDPVGRPSRIGPNGTTWADPAGRHPGVDSQDIRRLSPNDPRHPDHDPSRSPEPPRKLWHSSAGSAGH